MASLQSLFAARYLTLMIGLAAGLVGLGAVLLWQYRQPLSLEIISANQASQSAQATLIWVDIQGAVVKPGVYQLEAGSRVKDALVAAGGLTNEANRESISRVVNLAASVSDGAKLVFPGPESPTGTASPQVIGETLININSAGTGELTTLTGIGDARAAAIVAGRPYQRLEELVERKVVPESVFVKIKDQLSLY